MSYANYNLPTTRDEDWKYTDLSHLAKQNFNLFNLFNPIDYKKNLDLYDAQTISLIKHHIEHPENQSQEDLVLVMLDGLYIPSMSILNKLNNFIKTSTQDNNYYLNNQLNSDIKLNKIGLSDYINKSDHDGVVIDFAGLNNNNNNNLTIRLLNIYTEHSSGKIINNKNFIKLAKNQNVTLIEQYLNINNLNNFNTNILFEIDLPENAVLDHYILQAHHEKTYHISSYIINQQKHSQYHNYNLNLGSKLSRQDIIVYQNQDAANTALRGLFIANNTQHMDSHLKIYHNNSNGVSLQDYRGVLKDRAHGVWNGMVYVAADTKANCATQSSKNLLLSSHATIDSKPELQIHTDDVSCVHGATIGQLDPKAMFYLQSRGIPLSEAKAILVDAFIGHIILAIKNTKVLKWLETHNL